MKLAWSNWIRLTKHSKLIRKNSKHGMLQEIMDRLGPKRGVYQIKVSRDINRVVGSSPIVYIGSGHIYMRIWNIMSYFIPEVARHTAAKPLFELVNKLKVDVFVRYAKTKNYKVIEKSLLRNYSKKHFEGPPLNKSAPDF